MLGRRLAAHVETWRPYTATYPGLLAAAAACLWRGGLPRLPVLAVIFAVPVLGWMAALYGCDYLDSDVDRVAKGHRPIPSGRLTGTEAIIAMLACVYLGLVGSAWLGMREVLFSGAAMATSVAYGLAKGHPFLGPAARGLAAPCTILFGSQAASDWGGLRYGWVVLTVFFLHDITTNVVGEIRDVTGDEQAGRMTLSVRYGARGATAMAACLFLAWEILAALLPFILGLPARGYYLLYGPALALGATAMVTLARQPEGRRAGLLAHKYFVLERIVLAGAMLALVSVTAALVTVLLLTAVAHVTQITMRDRHELGPQAADMADPTYT